MKRYSNLVALIAAATLGFSCADRIVEEGGGAYYGSPEMISAVIANGIYTYTSLSGEPGDGTRAIHWAAGDSVHFFAITGGNVVNDLGLKAAEDIDGVNASFNLEALLGLNLYVGFYPGRQFEAGTGTNEGRARLAIPAVQTYVAGGIPDKTYPMMTAGSERPLVFKGLAGIIRFDVSGEAGTTVSKLVFRSTGRAMAGNSDWIDSKTATADNKLIFSTSTGIDSVVLSCPNVALGATPVPFYIVVADTIFPMATTEVFIEGSHGRKRYPATQDIKTEINVAKSRSLFYGSFDMQKSFDAHYITGEPLEEGGTTFSQATVVDGSSWLTLSTNAAYKPDGQTQSYYSTASPLYLHLDENLSGAERTATVTAMRSNGSSLTVVVKQQTAVYAGDFGGYGGSSFGSTSDGTNITEDDDSTPFSTELRGASQGFSRQLYVEAVPEYELPGMQFSSSSIASYNGSNKNSGLDATFNYRTLTALAYCANKNRDLNGNGALELEEIKWYLPALNQSIAIWITDTYSKDEPGVWDLTVPYWTSSRSTGIFNVSYLTGAYSDAGISGAETYGVRCVREGVSVNKEHTTLGSILPQEAITVTPKGIAMGDEQSDVNRSVFGGLRIAAHDAKADGTAGVATMSWSQAAGLSATYDNASAVNLTTSSSTGCSQYSEETDGSDKGKWRLPTQREMQTIWLWKEILEERGYDAFVAGGYWTATEAKATSTKAFVADFSAVKTEAAVKTGLNHVRCVSDQFGNYLNPQVEIITPEETRVSIVSVDAFENVFLEETYAGETVEPVPLARGETASYQWVLRSEAPITNLRITAGELVNGSTRISSGLKAFVGYLHAPIDIHNCGGEINPPVDKYYAPASRLFPDPLLELESLASLPANTNQALWVNYTVPRTAPAGDYTGEVTITGAIDGQTFSKKLEVKAKVYNVTLPAEQKLWVSNWFSTEEMRKMNNNQEVIQFTPTYWNLLTLLANIMRDHGQNVYILPFTPTYTRSGGTYTFDFTNFDYAVELLIREGGLRRIEGWFLGAELDTEGGIYIPHLYEYVPFSDNRAKSFLDQYIPALYSHLQSKGWAEMFIQHIYDEPQMPGPYNLIAQYIHNIEPRLKIIEANIMGQQIGYNINIHVPLTQYYQAEVNFYKTFQATAGNELWSYVCCTSPAGLFLNRFVERKLIQSRLLVWVNYRFGYTGFLHWGLNQWQTMSGAAPFSYTENSNEFPAGDSWIVYPDYNKVYSSLRFEAQRDGINDYELLLLLSQTNKAEADRIVRLFVIDHEEFIEDVATFHAARKQLLEALSR
jgi:hypothetical protein